MAMPAFLLERALEIELLKLLEFQNLARDLVITARGPQTIGFKKVCLALILF